MYILNRLTYLTLYNLQLQIKKAEIVRKMLALSICGLERNSWTRHSQPHGAFESEWCPK